MIYIENHTMMQTLYIPNSGIDAEGEDVLMFIRSTVDKGDEIAVPILYLEAGVTFYVVDVALEGALTEGEYEYELRAGDEILSRGLAIVGDYEPEHQVYDKPIEYTQYGE